MELAQLVDRLGDPAAYPYPVKSVEVRHTHISAVFLAGKFVYKVKKPVNYGFVDFSTLAKRKHFCDEELRLNRRLAPDVYLGVVPVTRGRTEVQVEGSGEIVEWAVKMRRLADEATLQNLLQEGNVSEEVIQRLAKKIADFHAQAESGPHIARYGEFTVVAGNARENFQQSADHVGKTVSTSVFERTRRLTEEALARLRPLIELRARQNVPRDTHGDLRLGHIYYFPGQEPPGDLLVIDCIEFNERFRFADPVSDIAFVFMGLAHQDRRDLATAFAETYFSSTQDSDGRMLLPFYTAYRAAVRAKVEGLKIDRPEISELDRDAALAKSRGYWLLALGELEVPALKPCLVLVGGLPGTGKSTLAAVMVERAGFQLVRSDLVRKELAGIGVQDRPSEFGAGMYSAEWTQRTYSECLRRAEALLFDGKRVLVDANFREENQRRAFLDAATRWRVPALLLLCQAHPETVRRRIANRRGDASDADWPIYERAAETWQELGPQTRSRLRTISTDEPLEQVVRYALAVLRRLGLADRIEDCR